MKKGFTLVELAIVIVIIGLLVGGLLVGQSLTNSANINSLVKQINQYDIAIMNFVDRYNCLPGDCSVFSDQPGNSNGIVDDNGTGNGWWAGEGRCDYFAGENANIWRHISQSGFQPEGVTYSRFATSGVVAGVQMPKAEYGYAVGEEGAGVVIGCQESVYPLRYIVGDHTGTPNSNYYAPSVNRPSVSYTVPEMISLDEKMDDGQQGGIVWSSTYGGCVNGSSEYDTSVDGYACILWVAVAGQIGGSNHLK